MNIIYCTTVHRYPIFSTRYSVTCKIYTGYHDTSEIEHGLCACTVDNPLAKARGLSLRTGAQTKPGDYRPYRRTNHALSLNSILPEGAEAHLLSGLQNDLLESRLLTTLTNTGPCDNSSVSPGYKTQRSLLLKICCYKKGVNFNIFMEKICQVRKLIKIIIITGEQTDKHKIKTP